MIGQPSLMKPLKRLVRVVGELVIKRTTPDLLGKIVSWLTQPFLLHSHSGLSHFITVNDIYGIIYNNKVGNQKTKSTFIISGLKIEF